MIVLIDDEAAELRRIMAEGLLYPVFQPILDFRVRAILGYEALIRGPENSALQFPDQLFAAAARNELTLDLEHACREASLIGCRLRGPGSNARLRRGRAGLRR